MTREIFKDKALSLLLGERFLDVKLFEGENIEDYIIGDAQGEMNLDDFLDRFYTLLAVEKWIKAEELEEMTNSEVKTMLILADTIKGEINRMCVTKELSELDNMTLHAMKNIEKLRKMRYEADFCHMSVKESEEG